MIEVMPTPAEFSVSYEGDAVTQHTMAVRELAPALLGLGQAFDRANTLLNGDQATVTLEIRATTQGSFEVALVLQQLLHSGGNIPLGDFIATAASLKTLLVGAPGLIGVFSLVKRLRGAKPRRTEESNGEIALEIDNLRLRVPSEVYRLFQDRTVREQIEATIRPVTRPGVDRLVLREGTKTIETIEKQDAESFTLDSEEVGATTETIIPRQRLKIVSLNFENGKWRLHDGERARWYTIRDNRFTKEVRDGIRSFRSGDFLICQVILVQGVGPDGNLTLEHEIADVLKQESRAVQLGLVGQDGEDEHQPARR